MSSTILSSSSVHSVVADSLWPHGLQHVRLPCPSLTPGACSNACPLSHWCHVTISSLSSPSPPVFPSIRIFSNESVLCIRQPKYWSFSFNISPSNEYSELISFRMDLLDLLAVQGTLKSLLQHHSSKASILQCSAFFIFQLSHPYMTTGKTVALTRQTFVYKVMSLLFNMLSRLVLAFLQSKKYVSFHTIRGDLKARILKLFAVPLSSGPHLVRYGCVSWTIKKAECWRIDAFEL